MGGHHHVPVELAIEAELVALRAGHGLRRGILGECGREMLMRLNAELADLRVERRWPALQPLVAPTDAALIVDDTDTLADGIQDQPGLLSEDRSFQGQEIHRIREDGGILIAAEELDSLLKSGGLNDLALLREVLGRQPRASPSARATPGFSSVLIAFTAPLRACNRSSEDVSPADGRVKPSPRGVTGSRR